MIQRIKPRSKPRPGRLKGKDLEALRMACIERDNKHCVRCGREVFPDLPYTAEQSAHMMHKRGKRMWGDHLDQVETGCGSCHRAQHNGTRGGKVVPKKG